MDTGWDVNENFYIKFFGFCFKKGMGVFCGKNVVFVGSLCFEILMGKT